jgi:capsular polysaccharide biosynthesis protein
MTDQIASISEGARFLRFLYRRRKLLIIVFIIALAAAVLVTLLMKPEYESSGIIFPTPTNSPEKILEDPQFGYDVDADWLMQVLKSDIVKDSLVRMFSLVDYFRLDTNNRNWRDELNKKYRKTITFERTRYMSIEITALTRNPEISADMVNAVIKMIDGIRERIFKENTRSAVMHYENAFFEKNDLVNRLVDSLHILRNENASISVDLLYKQIKEKQAEMEADRERLNTMRNDYNFYDLGQYINILNDNLAQAKAQFASETGKYEIYLKSFGEHDTIVINTKARLEGARQNCTQFETELSRLKDIEKEYSTINDRQLANLKQVNELKEQYERTLNAFEPYVNSIRLERLSSDYTHEQVLLNELRYKYETALLNYQNPIPSVYVINRAAPSYEKASPSFIKNGLIIIMAAMAFVIGLLLLREKLLEMKPVFHDKEL